MLGLLPIIGEEEVKCDNSEMYKGNLSHCTYVTSHNCSGSSLINFYNVFYCAFGEHYAPSVLFAVYLSEFNP